MFRILLALFAMMLSPLAQAGGKKPAAGAEGTGASQPEVAAVDISDVLSKLQVLSDGKQHYIAVIPFGSSFEHQYYGDGKRFYLMRSNGGGREGTEKWERAFWEPRVRSGYQASITFAKGKYNVQCGERTTELQPLEAGEQTRLLAAASFFGPQWIHQPYALSRDNKGNYYYVDRLREPENNRNFRLYAGTRGNLKLLKMTNVVSDSQGDIFTTKKGELRLVLDRKKESWFAGKKETELIHLPLDDNRVLIYTDLGVYAGQRLGTPCDDLM
jgi:hypothetical protein